MKFLIFGDVVGEPGRRALTQALPELREEYKPDSVIVNIENMAHGRGISPDTVDEALKWGADVYTTGDHAWDTVASAEMLDEPDLPIIRPANYPVGVSGRGYQVYKKGEVTVAVLNLQGQVFFKNDPDNPFHYLDKLLKIDEIKKADIKLLDFHAEATSEARGMGWHADGKLTAVWGTHTHVPTADAQVLPEGTGYITDLGMIGNYHSIIGGDRTMLATFLTQMKVQFTADDAGPLEVNGIFLETTPDGAGTKSIAHIRRILNN